MKFSSPRETSTPLPEPGRPGEIADRNTPTTRWVKGSYVPDFQGPWAAHVFELPQEREG